MFVIAKELFNSIWKCKQKTDTEGLKVMETKIISFRKFSLKLGTIFVINAIGLKLHCKQYDLILVCIVCSNCDKLILNNDLMIFQPLVLYCALMLHTIANYILYNLLRT